MMAKVSDGHRGADLRQRREPGFSEDGEGVTPTRNVGFLRASLLETANEALGLLWGWGGGDRFAVKVRGGERHRQHQQHTALQRRTGPRPKCVNDA